MIIVEGMDNSGKTTLVKGLSEMFNLPVLHSPGPQEGKVLDQFCLDSLERDKIEDVIYDRHPLVSEQIYGKVLRKECRLSKDVITKMMCARVMAIYCRPPTTEIYDFGTRSQMEGVIKNSKRLLQTYDRFFIVKGYMFWFFYRYDWTKEPYLPTSTIIQQVQKYLEVTGGKYQRRESVRAGDSGGSSGGPVGGDIPPAA